MRDVNKKRKMSKESILMMALFALSFFTFAKISKNLFIFPFGDVQKRYTSENFISPNVGGAYTDWGGVPSICRSWDQQEAKGKEIEGVLFRNSDWMCLPDSIGNKLGLYFQARTFAALHNISFQIEPACSKKTDSLISWLPQNVFPQIDTNMKLESNQKTLEGMCQCPIPGPTAHRCAEGWPMFSKIWHDEIRAALLNWSLSSRKPGLGDGVAVIHFRCGDIIDPEFIARGDTIGMGFLKPSFYIKHLQKHDIKEVHFLTTPLDKCNKNMFLTSSERQQDCVWGTQCSRILSALVNKISVSINLPKEKFKVYDHESTLWSMHHIVFSEISFCSPSTFCLFASLGSNNVIHGAGEKTIPAVTKTIPGMLKNIFEYDEGDNIIYVDTLPRIDMVEKVIEIIEG